MFLHQLLPGKPILPSVPRSIRHILITCISKSKSDSSWVFISHWAVIPIKDFTRGQNFQRQHFKSATGDLYIVHSFIWTPVDVIAINLRRILFGKRERNGNRGESGRWTERFQQKSQTWYLCLDELSLNMLSPFNSPRPQLLWGIFFYINLTRRRV